MLVESERNCHEERRNLERVLEKDFDIHHTTLQRDHTTPEVVGLSTKEESGEGLKHSHPDEHA